MERYTLAYTTRDNRGRITDTQYQSKTAMNCLEMRFSEDTCWIGPHAEVKAYYARVRSEYPLERVHIAKVNSVPLSHMTFEQQEISR